MVHKTFFPLKPGDTIRIVCPASAIAQADIEPIMALVQKLGFTPELGNHVTETGCPYYAADDNARMHDFMDACSSKSVRAIWCARGGYGSARLIPMLQAQKEPDTFKILIGFSDITALHLFINQHWDWPSLHAPVLLQGVKNLVDMHSFDATRDALLTANRSISYTDIVPLNTAAEQALTIESTIIGGNLSIIETSLGTSWQIKPKRHILFLEEVNERGYAIDRMLTHLSQTVSLRHLQAILIGDVTQGEEKDKQNFVPYALASFAQSLSIPVLTLKGIGHGQYNRPLPFNTRCLLTLGKKGMLVFPSV